MSDDLNLPVRNDAAGEAIIRALDNMARDLEAAAAQESQAA